MESVILGNFQNNSHSFLKSLYFDREYVVVSRLFMRQHPHILHASNVQLSDPLENIFHVQVSMEPNEVRFQGGFEVIRERYQFVGTVVIHFSHVGGANFDVCMFYDDVVEVEYANFIQPALANEHFLWTADLSHALCRGNQPLPIPVSFVIDHLDHRPHSVSVRLANGITHEWQLIWDNKRVRQCMTRVGWYQFCRSKKFKFCEQLQFFRLPQNNTFKVVIIRN